MVTQGDASGRPVLLTAQDFQRVEIMRYLRELPSPALEQVLVVAKSFCDGLDRPCRSDERSELVIEMESVRFGPDPGECTMTVRYRFQGHEEGVLRVYRRTSDGDWQTPHGVTLGMHPAAELEVLFMDAVDREQRDA